MKNLSSLAFAMVAMPLAFASPSMASLLGTTVTGTAASTGAVTVNPAALGTTTVGAGPEFGFCLGDPNACGSGSGVSVGVDISDNQVVFSFFGSTISETGTFSISLTRFDGRITGVTFPSGPGPFDPIGRRSGPWLDAVYRVGHRRLNAIGGRLSPDVEFNTHQHPSTRQRTR